MEVMSTRPTVYLAGPMHDTEGHGKAWRALVRQDYSSFEWRDPWDKYDDSKSYEECYEEWSAERIVQADLDLIDESEAVLAYWDYEANTCGTPMELLYAHQNGLIVVIVTSDCRDPPKWLIYVSDAIAESFDEGVRELREILHADCDVRTVR